MSHPGDLERPEAGGRELSREHRDRLVAVARRVLGDAHEAEDVAQEVLLRTEQGLARDASSLAGWLTAVCYRIAVDRLRARTRRERAHAARPVGHAPPSSEGALRDEDARRIRGALEGLDEPYRSAVTLRYLEELDFPEIARRLGTLERTARTWVGRGLSRLRAELREPEGGRP